MVPNKSLLLAALLLLVAGVGQAPHGAEAAGAGVMGIISGIVPCSIGSSINVAAVPVFPNASVQMVCGGRVVTGAKADSSGAFTMNVGLLNSTMLTSLIGNECKVVVVTPLAACNVSLANAAGTLTAPLKLLGDNSGGIGGLGGLLALITGILSGLLGPILSIVTSSFSVV